MKIPREVLSNLDCSLPHRLDLSRSRMSLEEVRIQDYLTMKALKNDTKKLYTSSIQATRNDIQIPSRVYDPIAALNKAQQISREPASNQGGLFQGMDVLGSRDLFTRRQERDGLQDKIQGINKKLESLLNGGFGGPERASGETHQDNSMGSFN